jgi:LysM repeat protein
MSIRTHALRRTAAAFALTGMSLSLVVLGGDRAAAAPIANSCGGVVTAGETTTTHDTYVVQKGDTLYQIVRDIIASRAAAPPRIQEVAKLAGELRRANRGVVRNRGNLIFPGQVLRLPASLTYCTKG